MKRLGPKAGQSDQAGEPDDANATDPEPFMLHLPAGIPGDQYRVKLSYFHSMAFDMQHGKYVSPAAADHNTSAQVLAHPWTVAALAIVAAGTCFSNMCSCSWMHCDSSHQSRTIVCQSHQPVRLDHCVGVSLDTDRCIGLYYYSPCHSSSTDGLRETSKWRQQHCEMVCICTRLPPMEVASQINSQEHAQLVGGIRGCH